MAAMFSNRFYRSAWDAELQRTLADSQRLLRESRSLLSQLEREQAYWAARAERLSSDDDPDSGRRPRP